MLRSVQRVYELICEINLDSNLNLFISTLVYASISLTFS